MLNRETTKVFVFARGENREAQLKSIRSYLERRRITAIVPTSA